MPRRRRRRSRIACRASENKTRNLACRAWPAFTSKGSLMLKIRATAAVTWGALAVSAALMTLPTSAVAQNSPVSVGAGVRTSFTNLDIDGLDEDLSDFELNSARIYLGGQATEDISLMFNTEYNSSDETVVVIDAVAKFE